MLNIALFYFVRKIRVDIIREARASEAGKNRYYSIIACRYSGVPLIGNWLSVLRFPFVITHSAAELSMVQLSIIGLENYSYNGNQSKIIHTMENNRLESISNYYRL